MGRVEKFKQLRNLRQKYIISVLIFITLLTVGICTADYSINNLIGMEQGLRIFNVSNTENKVEIVLMNQKIELNLGYINSDLEKLRQFFSNLFGEGS